MKQTTVNILFSLCLLLVSVQVASQDKELYLKTAKTQFEKGEYANAQKSLNVFVAAFNGRADELASKIEECLSLTAKAEDAIYKQDMSVAIDNYRKILSINPKDPNARNRVAEFEKSQGRKVHATDSRAVDLGLSVKWASCNVGATSPEEYGRYYAWGETEEMNDNYWDTYKYCNGTSSSMTKYCTSSSYGTVDNKTTLEASDDVATVKWGGSWRMPTTEEQQELIDKCTWTWTSLNGVNGYRVTGPNGNSIFLPAAGYRYGQEVYFQGSYGYYWSSSLNSSSSSHAYYLYFNIGDYYRYYSNRYYGHTVRPVSE